MGRVRLKGAPCKRGASIAAKRKAKPTGTKISYTDNEAGTTTTFSVQKPAKGARKGRSCVKRTKKLRKAHSCTRYVAVGKFKRTDTAGANSFTFTGRVGGKTLKPGSYRLVATPRNTAGKVGKALTKSFRIIR